LSTPRLAKAPVGVQLNKSQLGPSKHAEHLIQRRMLSRSPSLVKRDKGSSFNQVGIRFILFANGT
jgi:hypothetical protein